MKRSLAVKTLTTQLMSKTMRQPRVAAVTCGRVIARVARSAASGSTTFAATMYSPAFAASSSDRASNLGNKSWINAGPHHGLCQVARTYS